MKLSLTDELIFGTLDGANVVIRERVGAEYYCLFGKITEEIAELRPNYRPWEFLEHQPLLREAFELLYNGFFSEGDSDLFRPLTDNLRGHDPSALLADFADNGRAQDEVALA